VAFTLCDLAVLTVATTSNVNLKISRILLNEIILLNDLKIVRASESDVLVLSKF
jgi:hypothetical protein